MSSGIDPYPTPPPVDPASLRLFRVSVEYEVYVMAESRTAAEFEAEDAVRDQFPEATLFASEVTKRSQVASADLNTVPHADPDDRTIAEILDANKRTVGQVLDGQEPKK